MTQISRRSFLAATAGRAATPAFGQSGGSRLPISRSSARARPGSRPRGGSPPPESAGHLRGGRTGRRTLPDRHADFGAPLSISVRTGSTCRRSNPVAKLAQRAGVDVYAAPPGQRLRIGRRYGREGELEDFLAALVRCNRAIEDAARGKLDTSCANALPDDLGDCGRWWNSSSGRSAAARTWPKSR